MVTGIANHDVERVQGILHLAVHAALPCKVSMRALQLERERESCDDTLRLVRSVNKTKCSSLRAFPTSARFPSVLLAFGQLKGLQPLLDTPGQARGEQEACMQLLSLHALHGVAEREQHLAWGVIAAREVGLVLSGASEGLRQAVLPRHGLHPAGCVSGTRCNQETKLSAAKRPIQSVTGKGASYCEDHKPFSWMPSEAA